MHLTFSSRPLLEIEIRLRTELIREYLFSRGGLWRHLILTVTTLTLLLLAPAFQAGLPQSFPELPLTPLAWTAAYLASRRSRLQAYLGALLLGIIYDVMLFQTLGRTSALLLAIAIIIRLLPVANAGHSRRVRFDLLRGALATLLYQAGKIIFLAGSRSWATRLQLMPTQVLGAMALALIVTPLFFTALDGWERLLIGRPATTDEIA